MTNSNYPARQQGTTVSRKLRFQDFDLDVRPVVRQLQERGLFKTSSAVDVDEQGSFVIITYVDPTIVSAGRHTAASSSLARVRPQQLVPVQRTGPAAKPIYKRWWFAPGLILGLLAALCGAGYWALQQLKSVSPPNIGAGVIGLAFFVVLIVAIIKKRGGGDRKGHGGGYGFHYGPCD